MNTTPKTENRGCEKETWGNLLTLLDTPLFYDSSDYNSFHKWYRRKLSALKDYLSYHDLPADEKQLSTFSYYMLKLMYYTHPQRLTPFFPIFTLVILFFSITASKYL